MRAVHFVRSRQEVRELAYWLALVAYDLRDRSLNNRIYLLYIIAFFAVWIFITLTFFASGGALLLRLLDPLDPLHAAVLIELVFLSAWCVHGFWQAARRSPVVFSEADEALICQMPVERRGVVLRWLLMPWLKSAVPFWLLAILLSFSVAENSIPGVMDTGRLLEYAGYGLRAWLAVLPLHLAFFALQWAVGVWRLRKDAVRRWLVWLVAPASLLLFAFLLAVSWSHSGLPALWAGFGKALLYPLRAGFAAGQFGGPLLAGWLTALAALAAMTALSAGFNLSRAAQETRVFEQIQSAYKYGFGSYAEQLRIQQRLVGRRRPSNLPAAAGAGILLWKDVLQSQRTLRLGGLFLWARVMLIMFVFPLLPDPGSRTLAVGFWAAQVAQAAVLRLRGDLAHWTLFGQLPIVRRKLLLAELGLPYLLVLLVSLGGLISGSLLFRKPLEGLLLLSVGMAASAAGMAAFDVIRRARSDLLMAGSAPDLSAAGVLLSLAAAGLPWLVYILAPGLLGLVLAFLLSLGLGALAFHLAVRALGRIAAD